MTKCNIAGNGTLKEIKGAFNFKGKAVTLNYNRVDSIMRLFLSMEDEARLKPIGKEEEIDMNQEIKYRDFLMFMLKKEKE